MINKRIAYHRIVIMRFFATLHGRGITGSFYFTESFSLCSVRPWSGNKNFGDEIDNQFNRSCNSSFSGDEVSYMGDSYMGNSSPLILLIVFANERDGL